MAGICGTGGSWSWAPLVEALPAAAGSTGGDVRQSGAPQEALTVLH